MSSDLDLVGDQLASVQLDPRTRVARVSTTGGIELVLRATRAVRAPSPLPTGDRARIVDAFRVLTDEAALLTLILRSGDTVQLAGSGLAVASP
jgi:hypothetical protein